jgi:hypothetical protein
MNLYECYNNNFIDVFYITIAFLNDKKKTYTSPHISSMMLREIKGLKYYFVSYILYIYHITLQL